MSVSAFLPFLSLLLLVPATEAMAQAVAPTGPESSFSISSPNFIEGHQPFIRQIYDSGGCHGQNQSPAISWKQAPPGTASFAITMRDPDAPGHGWWHWAVANIPAYVHGVPENASRSGALSAMGAVQARNDFDGQGYSGPCPSAGKVHRYVLTVYALKTASLRVEADRPAPFYEHEIDAASLATAAIVVTSPAAHR